MNKNSVKALSKLITACVLCLLSACSTATLPEPKPAVLLASTAENTKIISKAMSQAMNGKSVTLLAAAFINSNQHVLEKRRFEGINSNSADGLILSIPKVDRFFLYKQGNVCHLVYERTGEKLPLQGLECRAI